MRAAQMLRTAGCLALAALPLAYLHVPGLPPFLRSSMLLAAGAAFAGALLLEAPTPFPGAGRAAGALATAWIAWQALSVLWAHAPFRWAAALGVFHAAAALAAAAAIASDPAPRGIRTLLAGWGLALAVFAANVLTGGCVETWVGERLTGRTVDHLPFGNRNTAALLIAALLPLVAVTARDRLAAHRPAGALAAAMATAALGCLLAATDALGATAALALGGLGVLWIRGSRGFRAGLLLGMTLLGGALLLLAGPRFGNWRLTTTVGLRTLVWESALEGWRRAPWIGMGAGTFPLHFPELRAPDYPFSLFASPRVLTAYNAPLEALCEGGIVGGLLCAGTLGALLLAVSRARRGGGALWTCGTLVALAMGSDALAEPLGLACLALATGIGLGTIGPPTGRRTAPILAISLVGMALPVLAAGAAQAWIFSEAHAHRGTAVRMDGKGAVDAARREWLIAEARFARAQRGAIPSLLDLDARFGRASCLMSLDRPREALEILRALMERGGAYGLARRRAAEAALAAGEADPARSWLEEQLAFDPCDVDACRILAPLLPDESARTRLAVSLQQALAQVPDGHPALEKAADWSCSRGDWEQAWGIYIRVLRASPDRQEAQEAAAVAGLRAGRARESLGIVLRMSPAGRDGFLSGMDALVALHPDRPEARGVRALVRCAAGDATGAREDLAAVPPSKAFSSWRTPLSRIIPPAAAAP